MAQVVQYGDISPRTAAYVVKELLKRALPYMVIERFGQAYPIPLNSTRTAKFRRYFLTGATGSAGNGQATNPFFTPLSLTPLVEGVTPAGLRLERRISALQRRRFAEAFAAAGPNAAASWREVMSLLGARPARHGGGVRRAVSRRG